MTQSQVGTIRALLVDDHALFRESVARALGTDEGLSLEHCGTMREAIELLAKRPFDLVLLDRDLGAERTSEFLPAARQAGFEGRVLLVTAWVSETEARRLLRQGIAGVFLKQAPLDQLREAIRIVTAGGEWIDRSLDADGKGEPVSPPAAPAFNDRQRRVLRAVVEGLSNKEIAWRLQISESYVKAILQALFQKTGVRTRGQLVRVAFEQYEDQL